MPYKIIQDALNNSKVLEFSYHDKLRIVQPYELGTTSKDKPALLAIQIGGESDSGNLPDWRMYDLNLISDIKIKEKKFSPYFKADKK